MMSTEQFWGATWYMLNQIELDRGPANSYPDDQCEVSNSNCWAAGNAGEMDFLETPWNNPAAALNDTFRRSFSTQWNQIGRKFNGGHNGGGFGSPNYLLTAPQGAVGATPIVYVAVVDSVGNYVYRLPADQAETIWPGIGHKTINATLQAAPSRRPSMVNPCRGDPNEDFCYVFTSNCQVNGVELGYDVGRLSFLFDDWCCKICNVTTNSWTNAICLVSSPSCRCHCRRQRRMLTLRLKGAGSTEIKDFAAIGWQRWRTQDNRCFRTTIAPAMFAAVKPCHGASTCSARRVEARVKRIARQAVDCHSFYQSSVRCRAGPLLGKNLVALIVPVAVPRG